MIDQEIYFDIYHKGLEKMFAQPGCSARLALLSDDLDVCLGYSIFNTDMLHFIFVKRLSDDPDDSLRRKGIGKALYPNGIKQVSHITFIGKKILKKPNYKHLKFNPFF